MATRRTHAQIVEDERRERRFQAYWLEWSKWSMTEFWLTIVQDDNQLEMHWYPEYDKQYPCRDIDEGCRKQVQVLMAQIDEVRKDLQKERAEYDKLEKRGWCHKADEKMQDIEELRKQIAGLEWAIRIVQGQDVLGAKPLTPSEQDALANRQGCLNGLLTIALFVIFIFIIGSL